MNPTTQHICLVFALIFASVAACGCSTAGSARATSPASDTAAAAPAVQAEAPESVEGAIAQIDRAEHDLEQALGLPAFAQAPRAGAQPPGEAMAQPPPPAASPPAGTAAADASPAKRVAEESSADRCQTACRALSGMSRATGHLCDLAGESDARCEQARGRLRHAGDRVRSHCPSCAAD